MNIPPITLDIIFILISIVIGGSVVALVEGIGHLIYPTLPPEDYKDKEKVKRFIKELPFGAFAFVLAAWGIGSTIGSLFLYYLIQELTLWFSVLIPGIMIFVFSVINMVMIPHPLWFKILSPFVCMAGPIFIAISIAK